MVEMSATCPEVEIRGDTVWICHDFNDRHDEPVCVYAYDLEAFVDEVIKARDLVRAAGHKTGWSNNADGQGNCGPVHSATEEQV